MGCDKIEINYLSLTERQTNQQAGPDIDFKISEWLNHKSMIK